jgi:NADH-quinone oxidoreductase subunit M
MLYLYRRVAFGTAAGEDTASMKDISVREWLTLAPIAAATLWMGVYPESFMAPMRNDVTALLARLEPVAPKGDAALKLGAHKPAATHEEAAHGEAH